MTEVRTMNLPGRQSENEKIIALVAYEGMTPLDLTGPLQVFSAFYELTHEYRPVVVGERVRPTRTDTGLVLMPEHTFDEIPHPYIVFVPGGGQPTLRAMSNLGLRAYLRTAAESAHLVMSVCTGALILASVGLLEGRTATTHWAAESVLKQYGVPYERRRWVEDGKYLMSAGVSAGIDAALHLVERLSDRGTMHQVQAMVGYDPNPPYGPLDYEDPSLAARAYRMYFALQAPFVTSKPKRLTAIGK
jgi:transcriptional regulator GlxA family with amidase domain